MDPYQTNRRASSSSSSSDAQSVTSSLSSIYSIPPLTIPASTVTSDVLTRNRPLRAVLEELKAKKVLDFKFGEAVRATNGAWAVHLILLVARESSVYPGSAATIVKAKESAASKALDLLNLLAQEANVATTEKVLPTSTSFQPSPHEIKISATIKTVRALLREASLVSAGEPFSLVSLDMEWCETDHNCLTEVGITTLSSLRLHECTTSLLDRAHPYHLVVKENLDVRNHVYVPDHKDDFVFGQSEVIPQQEVVERVNSILDGLQGRLVLVGHALDGDKKQLAKLGVQANRFHLELDTALLDAGIAKSLVPRGLAALISEAGIEARCLHNGGNDAFYTLQVVMGLMGRVGANVYDSLETFLLLK